MRKIFTLAIIVIAMSSCGQFHIDRTHETKVSEKVFAIDFSEYEGLRDSLRLDYVQYPDKKIGALTPKYELAFGNKQDCFTSLFREGGRRSMGVVLIAKVDGRYEVLAKQDDLKKYFAPIESKEEALSYAIVSTGLEPRYKIDVKKDFRVFVDTLYSTYSKVSGSGYEVSLFHYQLFGCGPHSHLMHRIFVGKDGEIKELESIKIYEDPEEDDLCVD